MSSIDNAMNEEMIILPLLMTNVGICPKFLHLLGQLLLFQMQRTSNSEPSLPNLLHQHGICYNHHAMLLPGKKDIKFNWGRDIKINNLKTPMHLIIM